MSKPLRIFIAGIIQGSLPNTTHSQDYRREIGDLFRESFEDAMVFDPVEEYPDSIDYDDASARAAFLDLMDRAGRCDILVAFVPEASMGTAIELWRAHNAGSYVVTVSGLTRNWVVRYLSDMVVPDMAALREIVRDGTLKQAVIQKRAR